MSGKLNNNAQYILHIYYVLALSSDVIIAYWDYNRMGPADNGTYHLLHAQNFTGYVYIILKTQSLP